ncbi:hypothetical protein [Lactobacillus sp. Sy-1]|uniref:hypothetical protein n=1 Tax=Lactobacillus sp. Sy-1 TaxID=2109645 RepID=UPI001C59392D|nr:hypothetical protein [Lactobacillus sp. Sy-1]MBW1605715.1 hypothetical protein [Lactobacillus sp. Sy-1]
MKELLKFAGISAGALAVYLAANRETPTQFFNRTRNFVMIKADQFQKFNRDQARVKDALNKLKTELTTSQKTIRDVQTRISEYTFEIQPHLDKINATISKMK